MKLLILIVAFTLATVSSLQAAQSGCEGLAGAKFESLRKYQLGGPSPFPTQPQSFKIEFGTDGTYKGYLQDTGLHGRYVCQGTEGLILQDGAPTPTVLGSYNAESGLLLWGTTWFQRVSTQE